MTTANYVRGHKTVCSGDAVYLRSLRIRAAEEKNIPRPSRELMSCK